MFSSITEEEVQLELFLLLNSNLNFSSRCIEVEMESSCFESDASRLVDRPPPPDIKKIFVFYPPRRPAAVFFFFLVLWW